MSLCMSARLGEAVQTPSLSRIKICSPRRLQMRLGLLSAANERKAVPLADFEILRHHRYHAGIPSVESQQNALGLAVLSLKAE